MARMKIAAFASVAVATVLCTTFASGDESRLRRHVDHSAAGDWNCRIGSHAVGTLFVRSRSYVLTRSGSAMAGEYEQEADRVTVTSGPLRGLGVEGGMLIQDESVRTLAFPTINGTTLACHEVL